MEQARYLESMLMTFLADIALPPAVQPNFHSNYYFNFFFVCLK